MAFIDRIVENPGRVTLTKVSDGTSEIYDMSPNEGTVEQDGTLLDADNLNNTINEMIDAKMAGITIDADQNLRVKNIQSGHVTLNMYKINDTLKKAVKFPTAFSAVPNVVLTPLTEYPDKVSGGVASITTSGFTVNAVRTDHPASTTFYWIAIG